MQHIAGLPNGRVVALSPRYETEPIGPPGQGWFLNAVALVEIDLAPARLLTELQHIEMALGRVPGERWGPRMIDLDIMFYGDLALDAEDLTIPHPRVWERAFVLRPLSDIVPAGPLRDQVVDRLAALHQGAEVRRYVARPAPEGGAVPSAIIVREGR